MKPIDILPDNQDIAETNGVTIRKGSIAAFMANIKLLEMGSLTELEETTTIADMMELVPILRGFGVFDIFKVRSEKAKQIIKQQFPELEI